MFQKIGPKHLIRIYSTKAVVIKSNFRAIKMETLGNQGSTLKYGEYSKYAINSTYFSKHIISQLVGHLLGDGSIPITKTSVNPLFIFTQTAKRFNYVWFVYNKLIHYSNASPTLTLNKRNNIIHGTLRVYTRSYPYLHILRDIFYRKVDNKYVKYISDELFYYLDDVVLAFWAMDDGTKSYNGFRTYTNSFTFQEVYKLAGILHYKFNLHCTVQNANGKPVINIRMKSMPLFIELVKPHFEKSMLYKLPN